MLRAVLITKPDKRCQLLTSEVKVSTVTSVIAETARTITLVFKAEMD